MNGASGGVAGGAAVLSSPLLLPATTTTTTTTTHKKQRQVIVLGSSSPLPVPSAGVDRGGASPSRQTTTSRLWDLPLDLYSSPPPPPEACLATEQARGVKSQAWKTGSRAEAIPDGAVEGFRSARELAAELEQTDGPPERDLQDSAAAVENDAVVAPQPAAKQRRSKKRKSDEADLQQNDAHPEHNPQGSAAAVETNTVVAPNKSPPSPPPETKQRRSRKRKSDEAEILNSPAQAHGDVPGKLKRVRKSKASAAPVVPTSDDMYATSAFWSNKPQDVGEAGDSVLSEPTIPPVKPKRKSRSKKSKEMPAKESGINPVSRQVLEPVVHLTSSPAKETAANRRQSPGPARYLTDQLQINKESESLGLQKDLERIPGLDQPEHAEPASRPPPQSGLVNKKKKSQPAGQSEVLREVPRPRVAQAHNIQRTKPASPAKPPKKPAKSSRTVTGIVLAKFDSPEKACPPTYDAKQLLGAAPPADTKPKRKRATAKSRAKQVTPVKLITPVELRRRVRAHDTLFGTSSQLAAEDSPRTIRMLQQAYRESEAAAAELEARTEARRQSLPLSPSPVGRKSLWSAAGRGDDGCSYEPDPWTGPPTSPLEPIDQKALDVKAVDGEEADFEDIDLVASRRPPQEEPREEPQQEPLSRLQLSRPARSSTPRMRITGASSFVMPPPPATVLSAGISTNSPLASPRRVSQPAVAQDSGAKSGPKKPRGRPRKDSTVTPTEASVTALPKKPRGRPRKDAIADPAQVETPRAKPKAAVKKKKAVVTDDDFVAIEDAILDPDPPPTPSPPRRRASPVAPLPLNLSAAAAVPLSEAAARGLPPATGPVNMRKAMADPTNIARMNVLFPQITRAVRSAPRGDCTAPSWWEKMLLYDPIVIEDLCEWLNGTGLEAYGGAAAATAEQSADALQQPEKVAAWMVQRWCEEKSVCCLWRGGLRGGVKARY